MRTVYVDCHATMRRHLAGGLAALLPGLIVHDGDAEGDTLAARMAEAEIVILSRGRVTAAMLARCPHLKQIVFLGTGAAGYIDLEAAARQGVAIQTIRGYGDRSIAEHAFGLMLAAARGIAAMDRDIRRGVWAAREGVELAGRTLGVVGTGGTGAEMVRIASGFGMQVIACNRRPVPEGLPCRFVTLDALLGEADVVSLHLALTEETRHILDARRLALMRPGAILVNTARGALVEEAALVAALRSGQIGHAALDVFETEPLSAGHPLAGLPNVTLTAHAAFKTGEASYRLLKAGLELAAEA